MHKIAREYIFFILLACCILLTSCGEGGSPYVDHEGHPLPSALVVANAAAAGDLATVKKIIEAEGLWVAKPTAKRSALHWAAAYGHEDIISYLVEQGLSPNIVFYNSQLFYSQITPLHDAVLGGHDGAVLLLLKLGADIDGGIKQEDNSITPYILAASSLNQPMAYLLAKHNADTAYTTPRGTSALTSALLHENAPFEFIVFQVEHGVDIHRKLYSVYTLNEYNPLALAARNGRIDIFDYLVSQGASPTQNIGRGITPRYYQMLAKSYNHRSALLFKKEKDAVVK